MVFRNHLGPQQGLAPGTEQYISVYNPFNKTQNYHYFCVITDYNNQGNVEYCSVGGFDLPLPGMLNCSFTWIC